MAGRFSVEAVFKAVDRVTAPVTRMQNRVGKFTRSMNKGFRRLNRFVGRFASGIKKAGIVTVAALGITSAAMANVIGTGAEFEQTLVSAAAKFPGEIRKGTEAFELLEEAARRTGATTEFTAKQSAEALNFLAMAGFSAEASIAALPGVVDLATVANVELGQATDIASDALGAFGLATKDATQLGKNLARINDVIAKTTTTANTDVEAFFETIKDGAPVATAAGASLETVAALTGKLANAGIKGSKAGTTLKNMFLQLSAPADNAAKLLKKLGVETQDSSGNLRDIFDILGDVKAGMVGMGTAQKSAALDLIFGKRAIAGVNILLNEGTESLKEYREELKGATGANAEMAGVIRDTVQGRLKALQSAIEGVKISIFELSKGPLVDVIERTTEWIRANENLIASNIGEFLTFIFENFENIVGAIVDIGKGIIIFTGLVIALKAIGAAIAFINFLMLANPLTLGIMAAVAAVGLLLLAFKPVREFLSEIGEGIAAAFKGVGRLVNIFGDEEEEASEGGKPVVVSPQERVAKSIEQSSTTNTAEVTIRDESGRAEVTSGKLGTGVTLTPTGAL